MNDEKNKQHNVEILNKLAEFTASDEVAEFVVKVETKQAIEKVAEAIGNINPQVNFDLSETNALLSKLVEKTNEPCDISVTLTLK